MLPRVMYSSNGIATLPPIILFIRLSRAFPRLDSNDSQPSLLIISVTLAVRLIIVVGDKYDSFFVGPLQLIECLSLNVRSTHITAPYSTRDLIREKYASSRNCLRHLLKLRRKNPSIPLVLAAVAAICRSQILSILDLIVLRCIHTDYKSVEVGSCGWLLSL